MYILNSKLLQTICSSIFFQSYYKKAQHTKLQHPVPVQEKMCVVGALSPALCTGKHLNHFLIIVNELDSACQSQGSMLQSVCCSHLMECQVEAKSQITPKKSKLKWCTRVHVFCIERAHFQRSNSGILSTSPLLTSFPVPQSCCSQSCFYKDCYQQQPLPRNPSQKNEGAQSD